MYPTIIHTDAADDQLMDEFNNTTVPYAREKTLFAPFEEQALRSPGSIALRKGECTMTYDELNRASNRLAHFLIKKGVVPGDNIGLLVQRDFDMIIGMLGILKAGGAYVPIDPEYPVLRQEHIFYKSALKMVVSTNAYPLKNTIGAENFLNVDISNISELNDANPGLAISSSQLAYTIYTSGSTGQPKGVMIEHHSAINLISWVNKRFNIGSDDRLLFITSMCFDLSVYDIFGILAAGGSLVIAENKEIQDVQALQDMLIKYEITFWDSVPTTLDYLVKDLEQARKGYRYTGLKTIFMSGDWIPVKLPSRLQKFFPKAQVVSLGGATEATVWSNYYIIDQTEKTWKSIPYGKPIQNNFFYILNKLLNPVSMGEIGDLYIGGVGVARGYADDEEKTQASFIPDPFNQTAGGMMYRTGDLGRMMNDYNMEFLGRQDNQVKINGFRVELGEIESVLNSSSAVCNAVVLAKDTASGTKRLIGYIVPNGEFKKEDMVAFLKTKLPEYMMPSTWIDLHKLPLTSNGKIDRNALPTPQEVALPTETRSAPETETEKMLTAIWQECIGIKEVGIDDNFFALGGHSLMAVQILSKLERKIGKKLPLSVLFKYPVIRSFAAFIESEKKEIVYRSLVAVKPSGSKTPLYIIHGEGLHVLNFSSLADYIDEERPIFGLQASGLNGTDEPLGTITQIAAAYLSEIVQHNPGGPYLIAGYSFGGYVAVEIEKQIVAMGKEVQMLIMFDTDAEKTEYKDWYYLLPRKVKRNIPIFMSFLKSSFQRPLATFKKQFINHPPNFLSNYLSKKESKGFYQLIKRIKGKHLSAFRNYSMEPFNNRVYLFKAKICVHYVDDLEFLGWKRYAKDGVQLYEVPGDHLSMLLPPNVEQFASILEAVLDNAETHDQHKIKTNKTLGASF
ncbi:amino acid adenylation domain-containing protein [Mucilaginibacter frigoritolerans]|uniref:Amino acid adenylation domain-containing protein n=1 Tax=Mucilaginibacter frigoritolerans TaxID=652788 RepID=A0A562U5P2_9SPHI|nr:amino acid adenylation domain-containing protein [Mucilaginibacter frigoritolerans]TWJ00647.1 amino acid adenylation domain-containing protein [Mucilaginibacter frigoritolerans]